MAYNTYNKYRIHAENGLTSGVNQNLETNAEYIADTERDNGCATNTVIKKNLINTGLRESTLFAASFADLLCDSSRQFTPNETIENTSAYILAGLKAKLLDNGNNATFGTVYVNDKMYVDTINTNGDLLNITEDTSITGSLNVASVVSLRDTLDVAGLISGSNINVTNSTFDSIMPKTANSYVGSQSNRFANVYSKNVDTDTIIANTEISTTKLTSTGRIALHADILPNTTNSISLGSSSLKFNRMYAVKFYGALSGNASTATKLNGTTAGTSTNPVYFNDGVPTATSVSFVSYGSGQVITGGTFTLKRGIYATDDGIFTLSQDTTVALNSTYVIGENTFFHQAIYQMTGSIAGGRAFSDFQQAVRTYALVVVNTNSGAKFKIRRTEDVVDNPTSKQNITFGYKSNDYQEWDTKVLAILF